MHADRQGAVVLASIKLLVSRSALPLTHASLPWRQVMRVRAMKKILHLTLKREWFDQIAQGFKRVEHRTMTPYWDSRLRNRVYDEICFRNGYTTDRPFMRVKWAGIVNNQWAQRYDILLGHILEIRNWPGPNNPIQPALKAGGR